MTPADRIDPLAAEFLKHVAIGKQVKNVDQISLRVDQRLTSSEQLFARFSTFDANEMRLFANGVHAPVIG